MMKLGVSLLFFFLMESALAFPAQIILIRHAEKPEFKSENLSEKGFQRAAELPRIFEIYPQLAIEGKPDYIFSTKYVPGESSKRTYQTIEPLARDLNLTIDNSYLTEDYKNIALQLLKNPKYQNRSVFISWTHSYIVQLAQALGSAPKKKWKSSVFDRLWVIRFDHDGKAHSFDLPQKLLSGDSTN